MATGPRGRARELANQERRSFQRRGMRRRRSERVVRSWLGGSTGCLPRVDDLRQLHGAGSCLLLAQRVRRLSSAALPLPRRPETLDGIKKGDTVVVVDPGPKAEWESCVRRFKEQKASAAREDG